MKKLNDILNGIIIGLTTSIVILAIVLSQYVFGVTLVVEKHERSAEWVQEDEQNNTHNE